MKTYKAVPSNKTAKLLFSTITSPETHTQIPPGVVINPFTVICMSCPFMVNLHNATNITCKSLSYGFKPPRSPGPAGRMFLTYTPFSNKPSETLNPKSSPSESLYKVTCGGEAMGWERKKPLSSFLQAWGFLPRMVLVIFFFALERSLTYYLVLTVLKLSPFWHYVNILRSHLILL